MMIRVAIICILLASVFAENNSTNGGAKDVGKGYGSGYDDRDEGYGGGRQDFGYGPHPGYGYRPQFNPPPPSRRRSFDTHYCSVHGSFALALSRDSGNRDGVYGSSNDFDRSSQITRQFCRYSAAHSFEACLNCCRVAARIVNTSPDDITSAIFSFDPVNPTAFGAGADDSGDSSYRQKREPQGGRIRQCVCCAPKYPI